MKIKMVLLDCSNKLTCTFRTTSSARFRTRTRIVLCFLFVLASALATPLATGTTKLIVQTQHGFVSTNDVQAGIAAFRSIPYAKPPIGLDRFRPPGPPERWNVTLDVSSPASKCAQSRVLNTFEGSEDCLYLLVYVPERALNSSDRLPVMFWIYGGAFAAGDASDSAYDASLLSLSEDVIVVAPQYRVDVFGFMAHPVLLSESNSTGNYGVMDQRLALQWVQANIGGFGGDPGRVTLFGQSAGGFSVCYHMGSRGSAGLFHAAIMESGSCDQTILFHEYESQVRWMRNYTKGRGCDDNTMSEPEFRDCVRSKSTLEMLAPKLPRPGSLGRPDGPVLSPLLPWGPVIDGTENGMERYPQVSIENGLHNRVPVLAGSNRDEGSIFLPAIPIIVGDNSSWPIIDDAAANTTLRYFFTDDQVSVINELYPKSRFPPKVGANNRRLRIVLRDYFFTCDIRRTARAVARGGDRMYLYHFVFFPLPGVPRVVGVYHGAEIPFVFGHEDGHEDAVLASTRVRAYWGRFAWSHDPNIPRPGETELGLVHWPAYDEANDVSLVLNRSLSTAVGLFAQNCDFWDTVDP